MRLEGDLWLKGSMEEAEGGQNTIPEKTIGHCLFRSRLAVYCASSLPGSSLGLSKGHAQGARGGGANPEVTGSRSGPEQRTHWGIQSPQGDVSR